MRNPDELAGAASTEPKPVDLRDYVEFDTEGPQARRAMLTDVLALDVICLEPQQTVAARTFTTADAVYTVLGGQAWVVTDDAEVTLTALQAILMPAGVPHGLRNLSADPLILQMVTSPPDETPAVPAGASPTARAERAAEDDRPGLVNRLRRTLGSG